MRVVKKIFKKHILSLTALFVIFSSVLFCCTGWGMGAGFELKAKKDCKLAAMNKKMSCHEAMDMQQEAESSQDSSKDCKSNNLISDIAQAVESFEVKTDPLKEYGTVLLLQNNSLYLQSREHIYSIYAFDKIPIGPNIPIYLAKSSFLF